VAVRKLAIAFGQSPTGPWHDIATWLTDRPDLNLLLAPRRVSGSTDTQFTIPHSIPGFTGSKSLRGVAIRNVRFFVLYNPLATGYSSYPGTARVAGQIFNTANGSSQFLGLPNSLAHTTTNIYVEQRFKSGSNGVATVFRKLTQTTHTISAVLEMTKSFVDADIDAATNEIALTSAGSAFAVNNAVRFLTTGTLPAGLSPFVVYYLKTIGTKVTLSATPGGATLDLTGASGSGTHTMVHAYTTATEPATIGARITVSPAFDPPPVGNEELAFAHTSNADGAADGTTTILSQNYGLLRTGDLRSLRIRCITSAGVASAGNVGLSRSISGWNDATRTVTQAAFPGKTLAGDTFAIEPINGVAFDRFGLWLPWSMFERDLNVETFGDISKTNPYPPGFDYPSHWHLPQMYGLSNQPVVTTGGLKLTYPPRVSWAVGGGVRLSELLGEEVWVLQCDFGGSSTAHREFELGTRTIAWYDPAQQNDWSIGRANSCYQRFLDELDACIAAAGAVGDTIELIGAWRAQSDADATSGYNGYTASGGQQGMPVWRDKYLAANRAFRARFRADMVARGIWPKTAEEIPFVQSLLTEDTVDQVPGDPTSVQEINRALRQLEAEDAYAKSWDPTGLDLWDGIHYFGYELDEVEKGHIDSWRAIVEDNDRSGDAEICNMALSHLDEPGLVTSLKPPTGQRADLCARFFDAARDSLQERRAWGQGMVRAKLHEIENDTAQWAYAYVAPGDAGFIIDVIPDDDPATSTGTLRLYSSPLSPTEAFTPRRSADFSEERKADGTRVVYSNVPDAWIRYEKRLRNVRKYPTNFRLAFSFHLASLLASPIKRGDEGSKRSAEMLAKAQAYMNEAARSDARSSRERPQYVPKSIRANRGMSTGWGEPW